MEDMSQYPTELSGPDVPMVRFMNVTKSYGALTVLDSLDLDVSEGEMVTVIGPSAYHYYSGMGPGMLGRHYSPNDIRFATKQVVERRGGRFVLGKAARVDPEKKILFIIEFIVQ